MAEPVVLFAPIDPRTDPLAQIIWGLHKSRGMVVTEAHVVVDKPGLSHLEREFLAEGEVLDALRARLGPELAGRERFLVYKADLADGTLASDELLPEHAEAYQRCMWRAARAAIDSAGERRVVFGLLALRRRSMSAMMAAFFQMLARRRDLLLDVRLSDRRAEVQGDFFFPDQEDEVGYQQRRIDPRRVEVNLVELDLPRLGGLLAVEAMGSYRSAVSTSQRAIDALTPPLLCIDLVQGVATADGAAIDLSAAELVWYAFLAQARLESEEGWALVGQDGHAALRQFVVALSGRRWLARNRTRPLLLLEAGEYVPDEDLRNLRGKTVQKLKSWCAAERPAATRWLVPEWAAEGGRHQRLPLPASSVRLIR